MPTTYRAGGTELQWSVVLSSQSSFWKTGLAITVNKVLTSRLVTKPLRFDPAPNRKVLIVCHELCCLVARFTGTCQAVADTGLFDGGRATLFGAATLWPIWWNEPNPAGNWPHTYPIPKAGQSKAILNLEANGGGIWSMETGDVASRNFAGGIDLHYNSFVIPPRSMAVFEVEIRFRHDVYDDGYVTIDFAQHPSYSIAIPSLDIALFTGASVDPGLFGTIGASLD